MSPSPLPRDRLVSKLSTMATAGLRLVTGPPGSGKTTLLRQLWTATTGQDDTRNIWCDASTSGSVGDLARCFRPALGRHAGRISKLGSLLGRLEASGAELVVYVDDAHHLAGLAAEHPLTALINHAPPNVRFVIASRSDRVPARLGGDAPIYRIGYADLRFRAWDIERLFRSSCCPLPPEAAATLCAQVDGWPIAVRLFQIDTALLSERERSAAARTPLAASARMRDYLDTEVLGQLPAEARSFMTEASVLGVLDAHLCDTALDRAGSAKLLSTLAEHHVVIPTGVAFRCHVLLQQHLERRFAELKGPHLTRQSYHHAAVQLLTFGHWAEAYRCYAHAGDWVAAATVLHRFSAHPGGLYASASVPAALLDNDPWIALAQARRLRGEGRLVEAQDRYLWAEDHLTDPRLRWQCALERSVICRWITRDPAACREGDPLVDDVSGYLREALRGHPAKLLTRPVPAATPAWTLGRATAALLDGRTAVAGQLAAPLAASTDAFVALAGRIITAVVEATDHRRHPLARFRSLATEAETAGWPWLARVARAATALTHPEGCDDAAAVLAQCRDMGDEWGALLSGTWLAIGLLRAGSVAVAVLRETIERARRLEATVIEAWLQLMLVDELERRHDPLTAAERDRRDHLLGEVKLSRACAPGPLLTAIRAPVPAAQSPAGGMAGRRAPIAIRCLGRYQLLIDGREIDLSRLRPQARQVLGILSIYCGHPVHEERLVVALWPDAPLKLAKHRLHVAISSLRAVLRETLADRGRAVVGRYGNAYLLRLPPGGTVDVVEFADALRQWRDARGSGDRMRMAALANRVLALYRGELLSEEGPAEWVLARREALRGEAVGVGVSLARLELDRGDATAAIEACLRALSIDELDCRIWTLLAEARQMTGGTAPALRTRQAYQDLVAER